MAPDQVTLYSSNYPVSWTSNSSNYIQSWSTQVYDPVEGWVPEERAAVLANARACRARDLSPLYRDDLPKNVQIRKPVLTRFQPVWSANRWRSVT